MAINIGNPHKLAFGGHLGFPLALSRVPQELLGKALALLPPATTWPQFPPVRKANWG